MHALPIHAQGTAPRGAYPGASPLRFACPDDARDGTVLWLLKRNCSFSPKQLTAVFASLALVSLVFAGVLWAQGALLVVPFAGLEIAALAAALVAYARHAADRERLVLRPGRLTVECTLGRSVERAEFEPSWVRVEPARGDHSLIELSGQGQRIEVGRFVRPEQRRALADELRFALRRVRPASATGPVAMDAADDPQDTTTSA